MKIDNATVDWREDDLPYSAAFDDVYFSRDDAMGESEHVFIAANDLRERWQALAPGQTFVIGELGFGGGLNFLQVLRLWRQLAPPGARLQYLAFEKFPLTRADITRLHRHWPSLQEDSAQLLACYPEHSAGCHRLLPDPTVILDLRYGDAGAALQSLLSPRQFRVDCWFLDGFTPARNPALWDPSLFRLLAANSRPGSSLSSYSVAGVVRQALTAAGFAVEKRPGFGRKRHMLYATLQPGSPREAVPWQVGALDGLPAVPDCPRRAVVIGAGLAGCSTAWSLARRGWQVTVIDRGPGPAAGASGIAQMALRCRLFRTPTALSEFFLHGFLFAHRQFQGLFPADAETWQACGLLQLTSALNRAEALSATDIADLYDPGVLYPVTTAAASTRAGLPLASGGWYFPDGGWLHPAALCARYLAHPGITFQGDSAVGSLRAATAPEQGHWVLRDEADTRDLAQAAVVVIANGADAGTLAQSEYLPLQAVRGQISTLPTSPARAALQTVVCGERTVFPGYAGRHTLAASYSGTKTETQGDPADDVANLQLAARSFAAPESLTGAVTDSQVAFRCNSSDRAPIVGPLAAAERTRSGLAALARNARTRLTLSQRELDALYHPGLFINVAHGSNGLSSCPLSAEILASLISGESPPCTAATLQALSPMRFLVRELKKQRRA